MYKLNQEVETRLFLEFYYHPRANENHFKLLNEAHGLNNEVVNLTERSCNHIFDRYKEIVRDAITNNDYNEKKFVIHDTDIENSFVQTIDFRITVSFDNITSVLINAAYSPSRTYVNKEEGLFGNIVISCKIAHPIGDRVSQPDMWELKAILSHELTHAYEDYKRRFNQKRGITLAQANAAIGYDKNTAQYDDTQDVSVRKLSWLMYHMAPAEINAYVTHLIEEVKPMLLQCDNSNDAWNIIKNSTIWKKYESTEVYLYDVIGTVDPEKQQMLLQYWNNTRGRNFTSFDKLCKVLKRSWISCRKKIVSQISKQVTDIAMSSNQWGYMDGKNSFRTKL